MIIFFVSPSLDKLEHNPQILIRLGYESFSFRLVNYQNMFSVYS